MCRIKLCRKSGGTVADCKAAQAFEILGRVPDALDNAKAVDGKIKMTNGIAKRYPGIFNNGGALTVVDKYIVKSGSEVITLYNICNNIGQEFISTEDIAVKYFKEYGISNGKIVERNGVPGYHLYLVNTQ